MNNEEDKNVGLDMDGEVSNQENLNNNDSSSDPSLPFVPDIRGVHTKTNLDNNVESFSEIYRSITPSCI